jgi:hypothetical protein
MRHMYAIKMKSEIKCEVKHLYFKHLILKISHLSNMQVLEYYYSDHKTVFVSGKCIYGGKL